jgi:hypothetical protein
MPNMFFPNLASLSRRIYSDGSGLVKKRHGPRFSGLAQHCLLYLFSYLLMTSKRKPSRRTVEICTVDSSLCARVWGSKQRRAKQTLAYYVCQNLQRRTRCYCQLRYTGCEVSSTQDDVESILAASGTVFLSLLRSSDAILLTAKIEVGRGPRLHQMLRSYEKDSSRKAICRFLASLISVLLQSSLT